jgi:hypothetical protein
LQNNIARKKVALLFAFTSIFDLLSRLRQQKRTPNGVLFCYPSRGKLRIPYAVCVLMRRALTEKALETMGGMCYNITKSPSAAFLIPTPIKGEDHGCFCDF